MNQNNKKSISLQEHLAELRERLLKSVFGVLFTFLICWFFSSYILSFFRKPIQPFLKNTEGGLIFTAPLEKFIAHLHVAFFSALFLSSPYWISQIWAFVSPGLYKKEKKIFIFFCLGSSFLFFLGALFAYFVVFPLVFSVLMNFGNGFDQPFITVKHYLSFIFRFTLVFALVFEMPLVLIFLCRFNIISPELLKKYRRQAIVCLSILSAFITPPDVLSLFLLLLPLVGLYELSIWLTHFFVQDTT